MPFYELLLLAVGVSMDAFAVSICKGLSVKKANAKAMVSCGLWFGGFQALMPFIGFWVGSLFASYIESVDHWVAFGLLFLLGANMLKEALVKKEGCDCERQGDFCFKTMLVMAIATSIDALAVGISLAMAGGVNIWLSVALIGVVTGVFSAAGVKIGSLFGDRFEKKAQAFGGLILIGMGFKILLEHVL